MDLRSMCAMRSTTFCVFCGTRESARYPRDTLPGGCSNGFGMLREGIYRLPVMSPKTWPASRQLPKSITTSPMPSRGRTPKVVPSPRNVVGVLGSTVGRNTPWACLLVVEKLWENCSKGWISPQRGAGCWKWPPLISDSQCNGPWSMQVMWGAGFKKHMSRCCLLALHHMAPVHAYE